jgi:hypothetical protein
VRTINISPPVWQAIAERGKFGESEDDVLRRVFGLPASTNSAQTPDALPEKVHRFTGTPRKANQRRSFATNRMSSYISGNQLRVEFATGQSGTWVLPAKSNKEGLRAIRSKAVEFAEKNGATVGQVNAVRKTLTEAGFHLLK